MKDYQIRFATPRDIDELVVLCELHAIYEKADFDKAGKKSALKQHLFSDHPSLYCLVVELNNSIIGYATFMKQFSTWDADFYIYMDCLFLKEGYRSLGIGADLMERIKSEAKHLGLDLIQWQTPNFNTRAIKFYHRIGASAKSKERFFLPV